MNKAYDQLTDQESIELASEFVALDVPIPETLRASLVRKGLLELILNPGEVHGND